MTTDKKAGKPEPLKCSLKDCASLSDTEFKTGFQLVYFVKALGAFKHRWFCTYYHLMIWLSQRKPEKHDGHE